jgi:hypothetical protein
MVVVIALKAYALFQLPGIDTFTGSRMDRTRWDPYSYNNAAISTGSSGLNISLDGSSGFSQAHIYSFFHMTGDFDVQVDFAIGNGWSTSFSATDTNPQLDGGGLQVYLDQQNYMTIFRGRFAGSQSFNFYGTTTLGSQPAAAQTPSTALSGSLRILSSSGTYHFMFNTGGGWKEVATAPAWNQPVLIGLMAGDVNAHVSFSTKLTNFLINSGTTDYVTYQVPAAPQPRRGFLIGGQFIQEVIRRWNEGDPSFEPMTLLRTQGMEMARSCMTTVSSPALASTAVGEWSTLVWDNSFWASREMVAQVFKDALQAGMSRINACFYMSDTAADAGRQAPPAAWQGLSVSETATQAEQYTYTTAAYLKSQGINADFYDVGNEILTGIMGFTPGGRIGIPPGVNPRLTRTYLATSVWPTEATLLTAGIQGIRRADPNARVALHVESGVDPAWDTVVAFFQEMISLGVPYDFAAISLPYVDGTDLSVFSAQEYFQRVNTVVNRIAALGKPVVIAENSYPWQPFAGVNPPMPDFPYTPTGQAAFFTQQLAWASNNPNVVSWTWFDPEWYPGIHTNDPPNLYVEGLLADSTTLQPGAAAMNFTTPKELFPSWLRCVTRGGLCRSMRLFPGS